jgi:subtilisin family serine protease
VTVEMRPLVFAVALLALLLPAVAGGAAGYNASGCRAGATSWANDPCAGRQWGVTAVKAPQAWRTTRGNGVIVAVIDTGVDLAHPDLRGRLVVRPGADLTRNTAFRCSFQRGAARARTSKALPRDDNGHGTHVAGIVAAATGNRRGVAGVAPLARVLPVKVLDRGGVGTDRAVARGICFAVRHGAKVINLSLGNDPVSSVLVTGTGSDTNRAVSFAHARGVSVVIAAGNESFPACDFPASHAKALCIGAVDRRGLRARYSNFGTAVGVVAPGGVGSLTGCGDDEDVWSTILPRAERDCGQDGYEALAGTSMATPHAAGVAALIAARFPRRATPDFVYERLKSTAEDLGVPGVDPFFGYGRVNAQRAVSR